MPAARRVPTRTAPGGARMPLAAGRAVPAVVAAVLLVGCGASGAASRPTLSTTVTQTVTRPPTTLAPTPRPTPTPRPSGPLAQPHRVVEKAGSCPYIDSSTAEQTNGSLLNRHTIVTTTPPGCRFYARNDAGYGQRGKAGRISVEIATARYRTAGDAEQGMIRTALAGSDVNRTTVRGHHGAQFRTRFSPSDGDQDWACAFVVGTLVVTVKTDRTDLAINALELSKAVAPKFH